MQKIIFKYYIIHKPFNVLSQFSPIPGKQTLKDYFKVPTDVYPVGRLDYDSEGLLLLTNDKSLNTQLLHPTFNHEREYWVQVEGLISLLALELLSKGLVLNDGGKKYSTKPCKATIFANSPVVIQRFPPIRIRKNIPDSWISLIMTEGKNRQVRKMTAAIGYPTLRLIRYRIEKITLNGLLPGEMKAVSKEEMYNLLNIKN